MKHDEEFDIKSTVKPVLCDLSREV
jgi:hypothetical protein